MSPAICAIILILSVVFIIVLLGALLKENVDKIITKTDENPDFIEMQLRDILKKHPNSEIYICNKSKNEESQKIIEKISLDFPQIHLKE